MEDTILKLLSETDGTNMLDDETLANSLNDSKRTSLYVMNY